MYENKIKYGDKKYIFNILPNYMKDNKSNIKHQFSQYICRYFISLPVN